MPIMKQGGERVACARWNSAKSIVAVEATMSFISRDSNFLCEYVLRASPTFQNYVQCLLWFVSSKLGSGHSNCHHIVNFWHHA